MEKEKRISSENIIIPFQPTWDNEPPPQKALVTMNGKCVLKAGNIMTFVARPGIGKSSGACEPIIASHMNPQCDGHGFVVQLPTERRTLLYFDSEMCTEDHWESFARTYKRAGLQKPHINKNVFFNNVKHLSVNKRKKCVENMLKEHSDTGLVILDGVTDFMKNVNSEDETADLIDWINSLGPQLSFVNTIHSNTSDKEFKPRGWAGSEFCRKSQSVFLIQKVEWSLDIREITTFFLHGKNRKDSDNLNTYFKWSDDAEMFRSTNYVSKTAQQSKKDVKYQQLVNIIFNEGSTVSYSVATAKIMEHNKSKKPAAEKYFERNIIQFLTGNSTDGYRRKTEEKLTDIFTDTVTDVSQTF